MFSEEDEVLIALKGCYPCEGCELYLAGDNRCANEDNCEAWLIYTDNIDIKGILHKLTGIDSDTDSDIIDILRNKLLNTPKIIIKVYADPYLTWIHDDKESQQNLACEVIEKLGAGKTFSINGIKIGFIPSKFIDSITIKKQRSKYDSIRYKRNAQDQ